MYSITFDLPAQLVESQYGHVHHGQCFRLLERGRLALLEAIGFPNQELLAQGKGLVITRVEVTYKREIKLGPITVTCEQPEVSGRVIIVRQRILNDKGKVLVDAVVESMFMDMTTRRGMDIPGDFCGAFLRWGSVDTDGSVQ